ncbi:MAG: hypothetical protein ABI605_01145 [Rhizobacter sp.]
MNERERFFELLPFFVNGTLAATDAAFMQAQLAQHPELQAQADFQRRVQATLKTSVDGRLQGVRADVGYARIAQRIAAEARPPWWRRLLHGVAPQGWRLAQGLALGLMVGVGATLVWRQQGLDTSPVRSTAPGLADGPLLRVSFHPQTTENELRLALIEARSIIVAGPTRLGDYYLKPAAGRINEARESLLKSRVVQQADEVPSLPAELLE